MSFYGLNTSKIIQIFLSFHSHVVCSNIKNICDVDVAVIYSWFNNAVSNMDCTASNDYMTGNQLTENDMEGSDKSQSSGTIPAFAWRNWGEP